MRPARLLLALTFGAAAAGACRPQFRPTRFASNPELYTASKREFDRRHWDNAVAGFERLTTELPPRDTLLPRAYWYLAQAHQKRDEWLLAAQSFSRLVENFPEDTLADDAALETARSYRRLWRKPTLDAQYGETALSSYRQFVGLYPDSPLVPQANREIAELEEWFARKTYGSGMHYFRNKAWDSSIIYFRDVLRLYPNAPTSRKAALRLAEAYRAIRYREDLAEVCDALRRQYPGDREVRDVCGPAPAASATPVDGAAPPAAPGASPPPSPPPPLPRPPR